MVNSEGVAVPEPACAPIEGLALLEGYECEDCGYACGSKDNMTLHHKMKHGWYKARGPRWRPCKVQTFFIGPHCKYFMATPVSERGDGGPVPLAIDHLIEAMLEEAKQKDTEEDERLGICR